MLINARANGDKALATKIEHMRSFADRFAAALVAQENLIKGVNVLTDKSSELKKFLAEMNGLQDRVDTFTRMYKAMKEQVYKQLKNPDDEWDDKVIAWLKKDKPGVEMLKRLCGSLIDAVTAAFDEDPSKK
jgi:wyosine [tRNA(Phe)-imidazoG37] synthetase (radical SAM superfamily)